MNTDKRGSEQDTLFTRSSFVVVPFVVSLFSVTSWRIDARAQGSDPLLDDKVENFDFLGLVDRFDADLAANPALTSWDVMHALLDVHLAGSDGEALGGDLAYQYGKNGTSLAGIAVGAAQEVVSSAQFGSSAQVLRPLESLQEGLVRLG